MADEVSPRTELRKRRQQRRRVVLVAFLVVLLIVAAAGVLVATRDDSEQQAAPKPPSTTAIENSSGISATYASAPLRNAITKGGDIAVYASPDAWDADDEDFEDDTGDWSSEDYLEVATTLFGAHDGRCAQTQRHALRRKLLGERLDA